VVDFAWDNYGTPSDAELHGYSNLSGIGDWTRIKNNYSAQVEIYSKAIDAIASYPIAIYIRGVRFVRYAPRYGDVLTDIHGTALAWNLERVQNHSVLVNRETLVIADEVNGSEARYRRAFRAYQEQGTFGYRSAKLDRTVDTLHFASSADSRLLRQMTSLRMRSFSQQGPLQI
jgi:hypothetical protein